MSLQPQTPDNAVVVAVDVGVDTVEALEDLAYRFLKVWREGYARMGGKNGGVGEVIAGPVEEAGDVGRSWEARGFWVGGWVVPEVFEFVGCFHLWAGLRGAELGDGAVEEVDLVVEVDDCISLLACNPRLVSALSQRYSYRSQQATRPYPRPQATAPPSSNSHSQA